MLSNNPKKECVVFYNLMSYVVVYGCVYCSALGHDASLAFEGNPECLIYMHCVMPWCVMVLKLCCSPLDITEHKGFPNQSANEYLPGLDILWVANVKTRKNQH